MKNASEQVLRVALRFALASRTKTAASGFFEVGDRCLYGKYKNHHGVIVAFSADPKGNPVVEIEPVPKGRKQNKLMGLFKIWHDPPPALRGQGVAPGAMVAAGEEDDEDD